jgi:sugar phosphate isomerase/epimerase
MKIGFLTAYSEERIVFAKNAGFDCVALLTRPGSALDALQGGDSLLRARDVLERYGIKVSALAYYQNHLEEGKEVAAAEYLDAVIELAPRFGSPLVITSLGISHVARSTGHFRDSMEELKQVLAAHTRNAQLHDVRLAVRNVPGWAQPVTQPLLPVQLEDWQNLLDLPTESAIGLDYDPVAIQQQGEDCLEYLERFRGRIFHVIAKELPVARTGAAPSPVDWKTIFHQLHLDGYAGAVDIEQEEKSFQGARFDEGVYLSHKYLSQYLA